MKVINVLHQRSVESLYMLIDLVVPILVDHLIERTLEGILQRFGFVVYCHH